MRLFTGIKLPDSIVDEIYSIIQFLKKSKSNTKWVERENIHLTLKFIGEVEGEKYRDIEKELSKIEFNSFKVKINGSGVFPGFYNPRVLWMGIEFEKDTLDKLFYKIENSLLPLGIEREKRKFKPHLTLGRIKKPKGNEKLIEMVRSDKVSKYKREFEVKSFILFESILRREGPIYIVKKTFENKEEKWT